MSSTHILRAAPLVAPSPWTPATVTAVEYDSYNYTPATFHQVSPVLVLGDQYYYLYLGAFPHTHYAANTSAQTTWYYNQVAIDSGSGGYGIDYKLDGSSASSFSDPAFNYALIGTSASSGYPDPALMGIRVRTQSEAGFGNGTYDQTTKYGLVPA